MSKKYVSILFRAGILLILLFALFMLPGLDQAQGIAHREYWYDALGLRPIPLFFIRRYIVLPLCSGAAAFFFLGIYEMRWKQRAGDASTSKGVKGSPSPLRVVLAVLALAMAGAGLYWSYGFAFHLGGFPPMPVKMGLYILNNPYVISLWWVAAAVVTQLALHPWGKAGAAAAPRS